MTELTLPKSRLLLISLVAAGITVLVQILWALTSGGVRDITTIVGVLAFSSASGFHAYVAFGRDFVIKFLMVAVIATFVIEVLGVATSFPFGTYAYDPQRLGFSVFGVPLLIPFAWFMMLYPCWSVSYTHLTLPTNREV